MPTIQCTISGRDSGGFIWQNVFHITSTNGIATEANMLKDAADFIDTTLLAPYLACMANNCTIYDFATKIIGGASSYTFHKPKNEVGTRGGPAYPGSVAGKIGVYPETGANVGHVYVAGTCEGDYVDDVISVGYTAILQALADAFISMDGSDLAYAWQYVIYNRKTAATISAVVAAALLTACYLSKRVRI